MLFQWGCAGFGIILSLLAMLVLGAGRNKR